MYEVSLLYWVVRFAFIWSPFIIMSTLRKEFSVRYDGDRNQTYVMKFIVAELKLLNRMVQNANSDEDSFIR